MNIIIEIKKNDKKIDGIEQILTINSYSELQNLTNANLLLEYYVKQNEQEKALYYAKFILDKNTCLNEINKEATKILERFDKK